MPSKKPKPVRAFISYSYEDRAVAANAKKLLETASIHAFLAHDDLDVSDEWRNRILEELLRCELFIPLLSEKFLASKWAPQEVGVVVARREAVIAPLSLDGTRSFGFIAHLQSPRIPTEGITEEILLVPLARRFPRHILPGLIRRASESGSFRSAEAHIRPLVPLFPLFSKHEAETFARAAIANGQIWAAKLCHEEYLPEFLEVQQRNIDQDTRHALLYQIENQMWYGSEKRRSAKPPA